MAQKINVRARTGRRAADSQLIKLLAEALLDLESCACVFWACEGPNRPRHMVTCRRCQAVRAVAKVQATLELREQLRRTKLVISAVQE